MIGQEVGLSERNLASIIPETSSMTMLEVQAEPAVETIPLDSLIQDDLNANKSSDRGRDVVRNSLAENGAGRSILIDKNGRIIAGNKTQEQALQAGFKTIKVIQTRGDELVAVQRLDIDLDSPEGRRLAVADNRSSSFLEWDAEVLSKITEQGVDLSSYFTETELSKLCSSLQSEMENLDDSDDLELDLDDEGPSSGVRQFNLFIDEAMYEQFSQMMDELIEKMGYGSATEAVVDLVSREHKIRCR